MGTERPPIYSSHGPPPQTQLLGLQLSLPAQALGTTRHGWEGGGLDCYCVPDVGAQEVALTRMCLTERRQSRHGGAVC